MFTNGFQTFTVRSNGYYTGFVLISGFTSSAQLAMARHLDWQWEGGTKRQMKAGLPEALLQSLR